MVICFLIKLGIYLGYIYSNSVSIDLYQVFSVLQWDLARFSVSIVISICILALHAKLVSWLIDLSLSIFNVSSPF